MRNMMIKTMVAGAVASVAAMAFADGESAVPATEVSVTADFASAYVFRGVTLNDGSVFQPGIEVSGLGLREECGSLTIGAWGNFDFDGYTPNGVAGSSFQETDWYASYGLPSLVDGLDLFVGYTEYTYGTGASDKEANIGAGYDLAGISLGLTYYQGVGGLIGTQVYVEGAIGYALELSEELSASVDATAAYIDPSASGAKSGFNDYSIGVGIGYALGENWSLGASLAYIGQGDDKVLADSGPATPGYDVEVVSTLSLAGSF